jgi:hypothetical protein
MQCFNCFETDANGQKSAYRVIAEQTLRPLIVGKAVLGSHLEWQFYCEDLKLVLLRKSKTRFASIDDPHRILIGNAPDFHDE